MIMMMMLLLLMMMMMTIYVMVFALCRLRVGDSHSNKHNELNDYNYAT
jgi:hypothetical protein